MVTVTGTTTGGLADLWPLFGLLIETPRLQLRLPREDELPALAEAARDIAGPDGPRLQMPWMYGSSPDMERQLLQRRGGRWHAGSLPAGTCRWLSSWPPSRSARRTCGRRSSPCAARSAPARGSRGPGTAAGAVDRDAHRYSGGEIAFCAGQRRHSMVGG